MSDDTTSSGQGATPSSDPQPATGNTSGGATLPKSTVTLEEALAQIDNLKHAQENAEGELKRHRSKLSAYEKAEKEAEAAKKAAEDAQKTELERIKEQHQEAEARIKQQQQQLVMAQVKLVAKDKGIINPELIAPVVERKLEYDKDGEPTNLNEVLDELIKGNPYLVKPAEPAPSPAQTATPTAVPTPAIPAMNPGRSSIPGPGNNPTGKPTRLSDLEWSR